MALAPPRSTVLLDASAQRLCPVLLGDVIPFQEGSSPTRKPLGSCGIPSRDKEPYLLWMKAEFGSGFVFLFQGIDGIQWRLL